MSRLLNTEEAVYFGKDPTKTWYIDQENRNINDKHIAITRISPYKIPWDKKVDGPRPADYFDSFLTLIIFEDDGRQVQIAIEGPGRQESIAVTIDGEHMNFYRKNNILSMDGKSYEDTTMRLLEKIGQMCDDNTFITPYIIVYNQLLSKSKTQESLEKILPAYLKLMKERKEPLTLFIPFLSTSNEQMTHTHWYMAAIQYYPGQPITMTFVDSLPQITDKPLSAITQNYYNTIVVTINDLLQKEAIEPLSKEQIRYAQGLQYGLMGCGTTMGLNIEKFSSPESLQTFQTTDQELKLYNISYIDTKGVQHLESGVTKKHLQEIRPIAIDFYAEALDEELSVALTVDRSYRPDIIQHALKRYEIAKSLQTIEKVENNILQHIIEQERQRGQQEQSQVVENLVKFIRAEKQPSPIAPAQIVSLSLIKEDLKAIRAEKTLSQELCSMQEIKRQALQEMRGTTLFNEQKIKIRNQKNLER
jgi:hypothetical protein